MLMLDDTRYMRNMFVISPEKHISKYVTYTRMNFIGTSCYNNCLRRTVNIYILKIFLEKLYP